MLPLHLFRLPAFAGAQLAVFAMSASFFALFLYTTLYLQNILHLTPLDAGLVYLPGTILLFVVSGATAELTKRISAGALVVAGLILVAAGLALMTFAQAGSSWLALLPGVLVVCAGTGLFNPALAAVALGSLSDAQSGLAAGVNDVFRQGGDRRRRRRLRRAGPGRRCTRARLEGDLRHRPTRSPVDRRRGSRGRSAPCSRPS